MQKRKAWAFLIVANFVICCVLTKSKVVFKDYNPKENLLFPPNLSELIDEKHPVKIVSNIIDGLDIKNLIKSYKPGGTSSYHPKMLLKVLIYGYLSNIYSSRKMEQALKENIHFMWLSAMSRPDHNTLNRFRSERLKGEVKAIFLDKYKKATGDFTSQKLLFQNRYRCYFYADETEGSRIPLKKKNNK